MPALDPEWENPDGVPISGFIFGGRRSTIVPLVFQAFNWSHGVFLAASMGSETTAAAAGNVGTVRRDPMAMLPFCGYHMADYLATARHRPPAFQSAPASSGSTGSARAPMAVSSGRFRREYARVKWIIDRVHSRGYGVESPLGWMPRPEDFDLDGLESFTMQDFAQLMESIVMPGSAKRSPSRSSNSTSTATSQGVPAPPRPLDLAALALTRLVEALSRAPALTPIPESPLALP